MPIELSCLWACLACYFLISPSMRNWRWTTDQWMQIWTHEKQNVAFVATAALTFAIKAVGSSDNSGPDGSGMSRGRIMKCDGWQWCSRVFIHLREFSKLYTDNQECYQEPMEKPYAQLGNNICMTRLEHSMLKFCHYVMP